MLNDDRRFADHQFDSNTYEGQVQSVGRFSRGFGAHRMKVVLIIVWAIAMVMAILAL